MCSTIATIQKVGVVKTCAYIPGCKLFQGDYRSVQHCASTSLLFSCCPFLSHIFSCFPDYVKEKGDSSDQTTDVSLLYPVLILACPS